MMYRESLRITAGGEFNLEQERERMKQFDEAEKVWFYYRSNLHGQLAKQLSLPTWRYFENSK